MKQVATNMYDISIAPKYRLPKTGLKYTQRYSQSMHVFGKIYASSAQMQTLTLWADFFIFYNWVCKIYAQMVCKKCASADLVHTFYNTLLGNLQVCKTSAHSVYMHTFIAH